jgi:hypothetical protein
MIMKKRLLVSLVIILFLALGAQQTVSAHGHTMAGDYDIVIGFHNEPAIQGEPNGLDLFVTNSKTGEKVNGLENSLKAEIIQGSSKKELAVEAQWGQDGAYTAYVLPTEAGDYTWHIFGKIQDTPVDVSMTSSPNTFGSVEAKSSLSFPAVELSTGALQNQSAAASQAAQTALIVAGIGLIVGLAGLALGALAFFSTRRQASVATSTMGKEKTSAAGFSQQ